MSNDTNTGGPAFPSGLIDPATPEEAIQAVDKGMTLRDYFAAKAMSGLMVRIWSSHTGTDEELVAIWARSSYVVADAMLKARDA